MSGLVSEQITCPAVRLPMRRRDTCDKHGAGRDTDVRKRVKNHLAFCPLAALFLSGSKTPPLLGQCRFAGDVQWNVRALFGTCPPPLPESGRAGKGSTQPRSTPTLPIRICHCGDVRGQAPGEVELTTGVNHRPDGDTRGSTHLHGQIT